MQPIPIVHPSSRVQLGTPFSITISEPICSNCSWLTTIPHSFLLQEKKHHTSSSQSSMEWVLKGETRGTFVLEFFYKKRCCGRPKVKQATYMITIY